VFSVRQHLGRRIFDHSIPHLGDRSVNGFEGSRYELMEVVVKALKL